MLGVGIDSEGSVDSREKMTMNQKRGSFSAERLKVEIFPDRKAMGEAAGQAVAEKMKTAP